MSFLEMLDVVNEGLIKKGEDPIAFDSDCREGICGSCGCMVNGVAHGPDRGTTVCQLHMRRFRDGDTIVVEPWRARAFPIVKDLVVDRSAFDRIVQAGGYTSINVGSAPDGNAIPVPKDAVGPGDGLRAVHRLRRVRGGLQERVGSALHLGEARALEPPARRDSPSASGERSPWSTTMDAEGFGSCSNEGECQAVCPKEISIAGIARMNREYAKAILLGR